MTALSNKDQIDDTLSFKEKFAYGVGDFGSNLFLSIGTLYLLKFYTDELAIPAIYGGVIFLISKFFTAFTDIFTGILIDSRKKIGPKGKFRPFIFYFSYVLIFVTIGQFLPTGLSFNLQLIVSIAFFMAFGLCYSLMNCSYGAMVPAITKNPVERAKLASFRQGGSTLGLLACTVAFIPIESLFSHYGAFSYTIAALVFSVCGCLCMMYTYANVKERYIEVTPPSKRESILKSLLSIFKNKPLLALAIVNLCTLGAFNIKLAMQVYYCEYVLKNSQLLSYMGFFSMGCVLIGVFLVPAAVERFGKKRVYAGGLLIWIIGDFLNFFVDINSFTFILFSCLAFFGTAFANSLNWALVPDTVDYGEWKTGNRAEGTVYTGYTFSRKISAALAGFLPGILLTNVGYIPNVEQTPETIFGLRILIFIVPAALAIIATITLVKFYQLDEELFHRIVKELKARRMANLVQDANNESGPSLEELKAKGDELAKELQGKSKETSNSYNSNDNSEPSNLKA